MNRPEVLIIGSGLAGLSSGLELALQGKSVLLVEAKGHVGGRTASWDQEGMLVESGLHRFLGFYSALPALLKKAGIKGVFTQTEEKSHRLYKRSLL
jgi:15-cis-phytoene desaturase